VSILKPILAHLVHVHTTYVSEFARHAILQLHVFYAKAVLILHHPLQLFQLFFVFLAGFVILQRLFTLIKLVAYNALIHLHTTFALKERDEGR
jgi:hypothetical protein